MSADISFEALPPAEIAAKAEAIGVKKAALPFWNMFFLDAAAGEYMPQTFIVPTGQRWIICVQAVTAGTTAGRRTAVEQHDASTW